MRQEFIRLSEARAIGKRMDVADVPAWTVKTTLQRTVQALKRHRDLFFADRPKDRPASIIITTLAGMAYSTGGSIYEVLTDVTAKMPGLVERRDGVYWVENPVHPEESFADRWRRHPGRDRRFFEWMEQAHANSTPGTARNAASTRSWRRSPGPWARDPRGSPGRASRRPATPGCSAQCHRVVYPACASSDSAAHIPRRCAHGPRRLTSCGRPSIFVVGFRAERCGLRLRGSCGPDRSSPRR